MITPEEAERCWQMADYLRPLPPERFDIDEIITDPTGKLFSAMAVGDVCRPSRRRLDDCGSVGCIVGNAIILFPELVACVVVPSVRLFGSSDQVVVLPRGYQGSLGPFPGSRATLLTAEYLFGIPDDYDAADHPCFHEYYSHCDPTPANAADALDQWAASNGWQRDLHRRKK